MDVMQFAGHVSNIVELPERPSVTGPDADGARLWLPNGWGVSLVMDAGGESAQCTPVRFSEPFRPDWRTEPEWAPAIPPIASGLPATGSGMRSYSTPVGVAQVLERLETLSRVQPLPGPVNNFACPYPGCGQLAVRDLSTLDYRPARQTTECEHCGKPIHRFPENLGTARAWRIGA